MSVYQSIGLNKVQEFALDRHLSAGTASHNGMALNALFTGMLETFQGVHIQNTIDVGGGEIYPVYSRSLTLLNTSSAMLVGTHKPWFLSSYDIEQFLFR